MIGFASSFLYGVAFALELWWILEAKVSLSVPAYILASSYLFMCILSLSMLASLRSKVSKMLLSWLLVTLLYIFPEAGLVLYMAIYHWAGGTCGVIEISLWIVRVFFNVCGLVVIQALWSGWREEKSIFRSLHELSITNGGVSGLKEQHLGVPGHHKLRGSMRFQPQLHPRFAPALNNNKSDSGSNGGTFVASLYSNNPGYNNMGYNNQAFSSSNHELSGAKYSHTHLNRTASSVSRLGSLPSLVMPKSSYLNQGFSTTEFSPHSFLAPRLLSHSQLDLPSFGLEPDDPVFIQRGHGTGGLPLTIYRGDSRRDKLLGETMEWYRPRSLAGLNTTDMDSVSMLSERFQSRGRRPEYHTQSLDRRLARGHKLINPGYHSATTHGGQTRQGSRQSLGQISAISDSPEKYRDIAL